MQTLLEVARRFTDGSNYNTKYVAGLYELYDRYLAELADAPITLLELGVYSGESLKTFGSYFRKGRIIGIDIEDRGIDLSHFSNVLFVRADQRDGAALARICREHAPSGIDVIIDDASHIGAWSLMSYEALFPFLKPGGLYIIEDWATGYWDDWPDGSRFQRFPLDGPDAKRIASHDFGMVGFVKYLIDEVMSSGIRSSMSAPLTREDRFAEMHAHKRAVVLRKAWA